MRRYLLILATILAAVAGVVVLSLFRSPTLGLDLQGGLEVILQAKAPQGREITQDDLDRSIEIMRHRIDKLGVSEPVITRQGSDQISVAAGRRPRCRPRGRDHRPDRPAPVLRPPGRCASADQGRERASRRLAEAPTAPVGRAGGGEDGHPHPVVPLLEGRGTPCGPERDEGGHSQAGRGRAARRLEVLRRAAGQDHPHLHRQRDSLPGGRRARTGRNLLLPLQVPADQCDAAGPGADGKRPERRRHELDLRTGEPTRRPARLHVERRRQVPQDHPRALPAGPEPGEPRRAAGQFRLLAELRDRSRRRDPLISAD